MFTGMGTLINLGAIIIGSAIGVGAGNRLKSQSQRSITDVLGLITALGAVGALSPLWSDDFTAALPQGAPLLTILLTMLIGGLIGTALNLESRLDVFGVYLRRKFKASEESPFLEGFVTASLLFLIGPLAILGSISDGAGLGIDQLLLKE